ncbi:hypothetical protein [Thioalkalivibrio sp. ALJ9]|uniref:hypothetical protein n=1 Tax=Thioalkalivibrio sp. ALJ9 TaxID=1158758 RepID=UPI0003AA98E7|nr:hypothetical protein [Thioalkalivibrio sp. ALJ9]
MDDKVGDALKRLYQESGNFVVLGLTGRTGSGCSTTANILSSEAPGFPETSGIYRSSNDSIKYNILRRYIQAHWRPFVPIRVRSIITKIILELDFDRFCSFVAETLNKDNDDILDRLSSHRESYAKAHGCIADYNSMPDANEVDREVKIKRAWEVHFEELPGFCSALKTLLQDKLGPGDYTRIYQKAGDNIRASGCARQEDFDANKIFKIPIIINKLIKVVRRRCSGGAFVVIDAIRNPFEAVYFQQRYSAFYLVSINAPNPERLNHLRRTHKFSEDQIADLDKKEYPKKLEGKQVYVSQNIQKCIEIADIHINNPDRHPYDNQDLISQLLWYVSLMLHPGLVTPTANERCMQLAYSVKLNSGCISRQVGAVVADRDYSVKAVGWNNTPEGQTPCILRNAKKLLDGGEDGIYSRYEMSDPKFRKVLEDTYGPVKDGQGLEGINMSFCFKDLQNEVEGEKNQVHTRSLHAEENAFLQIAKYGGQPVIGGILFSTASPCELCSKKAYQLGVRTIVYLDPYPGISRDHILDVGEARPEMVLFSGALGRAYHRLYQPFMPLKEELQMAAGYTITGGEKRNRRELRVRNLEEEVARLKAENSRLKEKPGQ